MKIQIDVECQFRGVTLLPPEHREKMTDALLDFLLPPEVESRVDFLRGKISLTSIPGDVLERGKRYRLTLEEI